MRKLKSIYGLALFLVDHLMFITSNLKAVNQLGIFIASENMINMKRKALNRVGIEI